MSKETVNIVGIQKAKVYPLNNQVNYSWKNSNPLIQFNISPQDQRLLDSSTIRLNFNFDILKVDNTDRNTNQDVSIDSRIGISSIIDTIRIRQSSTGEIVEELREYGQMCSLVQPAQLSLSNYQKWATAVFGATGSESRSLEFIKKRVPISLVLKNGLFSSGSLMNLKALGGLSVEINLQSDAQVLFGANSSGYYYRVNEPRLTFNFVELANPIMGQSFMTAYPQYTNFNSMLSSSNDTLSMVFNQQAVRTIFSKTVRSQNLNNYAENGFRTNRILDSSNASKRVEESTVFKDSVKYPREFITNERDAVDNGVYECLKNAQFLECFKPLHKFTNCIQSPITQGVRSNPTAIIGFNNAGNDLYYGGLVGVNYDALRNGSSIDMNGSLFSVRIQSQLTDSEPNNIYTFTLSNKVLKSNPSGVETTE